jgi:hypothetical protein
MKKHHHKLLRGALLLGASLTLGSLAWTLNQIEDRASCEAWNGTLTEDSAVAGIIRHSPKPGPDEIMHHHPAKSGRVLFGFLIDFLGESAVDHLVNADQFRLPPSGCKLDRSGVPGIDREGFRKALEAAKESKSEGVRKAN